MKKLLIALPLTLVFSAFLIGCHKKEAPPPPPPPPPVEEKKPEPKVDDSAERAAAERARRLAAAKETISQAVVYFDFDKSNVKDEFRGTLMKCADALKEFSELSITVEGHCDERGTAAYNLALGDRRANAVKRFLVDAGVSGSKIMTKSWGEERPAVEGVGEAVWSKNRRAEFNVQ